MENRNQPATGFEGINTVDGLTKREYAAIHLAAAAFSGQNWLDTPSTWIAREAVIAADAVFDELEKKER